MGIKLEENSKTIDKLEEGSINNEEDIKKL